MAEAGASDLFSEQELTCSICLDLFDEPVSTPCGHNFCQVRLADTPEPRPLTLTCPPVLSQACIGGYWASSATCTCPLCKHQFPERPQLSVNKVFALIADKFKETRYSAAGLPVPAPRTGAASADGGAAGASGEEVVWCDVCTGVKRPATSSCLTCTASYCAEHEQPHRSTPFYAKHQLMDPGEALRGRTCALHRRLLEVSGTAGVGGVWSSGGLRRAAFTSRSTVGFVSAASVPSASWRNIGHTRRSLSKPRDLSNR